MLEKWFLYPSEVLLPINFQSYRRVETNPPLDFTQISATFATGEERMDLGIHVGGHVSLIIVYKGIPSFAMSYERVDNALVVVQMQGTKRKDRGYRVNSGMDVPKFYADATLNILQFSPGIKRILLPLKILGIEEDAVLLEKRTEGTNGKYNAFRDYLGMRYDPSCKAFSLEKAAVQ